MRRSNLYTLRRISCEKQVVPVRVSHATREIETQVEESARKAQGECKRPVTCERRSSFPACISPLARAFPRFPCTFLAFASVRVKNANVRHDTINFCVLDCCCARFDKAWLDYQMALKISPQNSTALHGNYR